jgi:hypothetical protein
VLIVITSVRDMNCVGLGGLASLDVPQPPRSGASQGLSGRGRPPAR